MRFWDLTPSEFAAVAHGHAVRQGQEWYRTAWHTSYVLSGLIGKKAPKPEQLVGAATMALIRPRKTRPIGDDD